MARGTKKADSSTGLTGWLEERGRGAKRSCVICANYGAGSEEAKALAEFLDMTPDERHGTAFNTFVRLYLHKRMDALGDATTWRSHVVRCLGRGSSL